MDIIGDCIYKKGSFNRLRETFGNLKASNDLLESLIQKIEEYHVTVKKFLDKLNDKSFAAGVNDYSTVDVTDSVDQFITQELEALKVSKIDMNEKLKELETSLQMENSATLLENAEHFWKLAAAICSTQEMMSKKIESVNENEHMNLFSAMLLDYNAEKSE